MESKLRFTAVGHHEQPIADVTTLSISGGPPHELWRVSYLTLKEKFRKGKTPANLAKTIIAFDRSPLCGHWDEAHREESGSLVCLECGSEDSGGRAARLSGSDINSDTVAEWLGSSLEGAIDPLQAILSRYSYSDELAVLLKRVSNFVGEKDRGIIDMTPLLDVTQEV